MKCDKSKDIILSQPEKIPIISTVFFVLKFVMSKDNKEEHS
jgi:hypothetical protein